jgi:hypothetical protein
MNRVWIAAFLTIAAPLACAAQVRLGDPAPNPEKARAEAIERAKTVLREALERPKAEEITVESAKAATWPDASLGCPEKDRMYAQVVTSGWTVVLKAAGQTHEVHVAGKRAVICVGHTKGPGDR